MREVPRLSSEGVCLASCSARGSLGGWERECKSGTFWINREGYTPADGTRYGDAFFELMDHVDATYRTQPAAEVDAR